MRKIIEPGNMPPPASHYHHGILVSGEPRTLYLSGQLGERADGTISGTIEDQAEQAWRNVKLLLAEAGMSVSNVTKVTSYIVGRDNIDAYVERHRLEVKENKPPWTLLVVEGLGNPEYLVEIDVIASR